MQSDCLVLRYYERVIQTVLTVERAEKTYTEHNMTALSRLQMNWSGLTDYKPKIAKKVSVSEVCTYHCNNENNGSLFDHDVHTVC